MPVLAPDDPASPGRKASVDARLAAATEALRARAAGHDHDDADPVSLCSPLTAQGLFVDALPIEHGGGGLATDPRALDRLVETLQAVGGADLSAGRIFEGHVNAIKLVFRYGGPTQQAALAADVCAGAVCGVWNAEAPPGLRIDGTPMGGTPSVLTGAKIYASGLGLVTRPLVTARTPKDEMLMLAPRLPPNVRHDLSGWRVRGMRASATGTVDLTGLAVAADDVVGAPGDYYRSPLFKAGAWRFAAVQCGAVMRLSALLRQELRARGRAQDPHQKVRVGTAAIAAETARLWVAHAAQMAEDPACDPADADAYVNLARIAVERAALEAIGLAERGLGLSAFTRPSPVDRLVRDLSTYLRQPFPDAALDDAASRLLSLEAGLPWEHRPGSAT